MARLLINQQGWETTPYSHVISLPCGKIHSAPQGKTEGYFTLSSPSALDRCYGKSCGRVRMGDPKPGIYV